ncbi:TcpD family membrane protein [Rummeliibacillus pycnus]|uniref:TcpD family membrane protein n=1 Tax=Rummeliibacillus pycnus TaxID=101070 RepID=UPI003D2C406E
MNLSLQTLYDWFKTQGSYALMIALICVTIYFAFKRQWLGLIGAIAGLAFVGIFISNPELISSLSTWVATKLGISGSSTPTK